MDSLSNLTSWVKDYEAEAKIASSSMLESTKDSMSSFTGSVNKFLGVQESTRQTPNDVEMGEMDGLIASSQPTADGAASSGDSSWTGSSGDAGWGTVSRSDRFKGFVVLLGLSMFFFSLATFFLSVVLLFPAKFALSFTLGSLCFMGAFAFMQGPYAYLQSICTKERIPFTAGYFLSMFGTLYSCLVLRSYIMVILCSGVQFAALGWYGVTYVPGGKIGMKVVTTTLVTTLKGCAKGCYMVFSRLMG